MVRVEEGPEGKSAPLIGGDDQRPSSGVPLIDAWIARADALRCVRRGYFRAFGPLPLTPLELQASVEEVTKIVREKAKDLLKIAPRDQRDLLLSLAKVVDQPTPNDQALTEAIRELLAASAVWIPLSRKGVIETEWKEVQTRLLAMRKKGKPYTSMADLARRCECGSSTVHKAIHASAELEGWMARHTKATVLPHATSLSDIVTENTPQESENEPSDVLIKHDIDIEMRRLIEQASPEEKARMNTMNEEERCELVKTFNEQYRDREPSPLRGDPPDKRPTKVISSKRL